MLRKGGKRIYSELVDRQSLEGCKIRTSSSSVLMDGIFRIAERLHAFKPSNLPSSVYPHSGEAVSLYGEVLCSAGLSHAVKISIASLCRRRFTAFTRGVQTHLGFDSDLLIL